MPRFSKESKNIFDLIWYKADFNKAKALITELKKSVDICFAKISSTFYLFNFFKVDLALDVLKEAENLNHMNNDKFIQFLINTMYFSYYAGWNSPPVNIDLAKHHLNQALSDYPQIDFVDEWERYFCEGWINLINGTYFGFFEKDLTKGIEYYERLKEIWRLVPQDGEYISNFMGNQCLGYFFRLSGKFDEAERVLSLALQETEKYESLWQNFPLVSLFWSKFQRGELSEAKKLSQRSLKISREFNDNMGIYFNLTAQGDFLFDEGKYDQSLEFYQESLSYRKKHGDKLELFKGYNRIFDYNYFRFKTTKKKEFLDEAEKLVRELEILNEMYPEDKTIANYTMFAQGCLLKYGNLKKRAKAAMVFDDLIEMYPFNFTFALEYLELLFEDFLISEDNETIEKIDSLMLTIHSIPLTIVSVGSFVHQQIILAEFNFYIKNEPNLAFEILNNARDNISIYNITYLNLLLDNKLELFMQERNKWENIDISVKERIKKSEFNKYIQEAQMKIN